MSQLLHRTRTYASFINFCLLFPLLFSVNIFLIYQILKEGFSVGYFIGVVFLSAICLGLIEILFHDFKVIEFYSDKLVIRKPLKRKGIFRKGRNEWILLSSEWDEAFHISSRSSGSTIYFRKNKTAIFILNYENGGFIIDKFQRYYSEKKIEVHVNKNNTIQKERSFPAKTITILKKNLLERYVN